MSILAILQKNSQSALIIKRTYDIFEFHKSYSDKSNFRIDLAQTVGVTGNSLEIAQVKSYIDKMMFLILCRNAAIRVTKTAWKDIQDGLLLA
ncbi:hypothetical protein [Mucilaginibacter sp. dw_454]|uniref:hypothetical protein n=1 Tax=Mucilaginibacter sp. dw_454 TaxID=2720079 RepID=UPI001BD5E70D|nr:hypothetical protein [Mucilaginibacter sp. dw_454]